MFAVKWNKGYELRISSRYSVGVTVCAAVDIVFLSDYRGNTEVAVVCSLAVNITLGLHCCDLNAWSTRHTNS